MRTRTTKGTRITLFLNGLGWPGAAEAIAKKKSNSVPRADDDNLRGRELLAWIGNLHRLINFSNILPANCQLHNYTARELHGHEHAAAREI